MATQTTTVSRNGTNIATSFSLVNGSKYLVQCLTHEVYFAELAGVLPAIGAPAPRHVLSQGEFIEITYDSAQPPYFWHPSGAAVVACTEAT